MVCKFGPTWPFNNVSGRVDSIREYAVVNVDIVVDDENMRQLNETMAAEVSYVS